jgi:hypothetical protein
MKEKSHGACQLFTSNYDIVQLYVIYTCMKLATRMLIQQQSVVQKEASILR